MSEPTEDYKKENEKLKKEIESLKHKLSLYEVDGGVGLYYELNKLINSTVNYIRKKNSMESLIDEESKAFERTMALIKNAKEHLTDLQEIKRTLGLTGDEKIDKERKPFVDTIADVRK